LFGLGVIGGSGMKSPGNKLMLCSLASFIISGCHLAGMIPVFTQFSC
jgi:hypothetical protein